jgi:hypothetical protein
MNPPDSNGIPFSSMALFDQRFERSFAVSLFGSIADPAKGGEDIRIAFSGVLYPVLGFKRSDMKFSDRVHSNKLAFLSGGIKSPSAVAPLIPVLHMHLVAKNLKISAPLRETLWSIPMPSLSRPFQRWDL